MFAVANLIKQINNKTAQYNTALKATAYPQYQIPNNLIFPNSCNLIYQAQGIY
jgi:hypothetical protein